LGQNDGVAALLVSEQSHTVWVEQVRLRCLRGAGPFAGVLEMRGIADREQATVRRARNHRSVSPIRGTAVALNLDDRRKPIVINFQALISRKIVF
jgi:hypothetical protein